MPRSATSPIPFVIVCDLRTGSTLLGSTLHRHPQIRCRGELLHPDDLPDNQLATDSRHKHSADHLIRYALTDTTVHAIGFRAMISHPDTTAQPQWAEAWDVLASWPGLRVIVLHREDVLAQYASLCIAGRTRQFHPGLADVVPAQEHRPTVHIDPDALAAWHRERMELYALRRGQLRDQPTLTLSYEALTADWSAQMLRAQAFLGVQPRALPPMKTKQERRALAAVIDNYASLRDEVAR